MFTNTNIYEKIYEEALKNNEQTVREIEAFKKELEGVRQNLESNQKYLFQNVMAPITSNALIKGKLVHTNEVFAHVGDNWFIKTSAARALEICDRRIKKCNENLAEIERQTKKFSSNVQKSQEFDIFPIDDVKEIIEPYDEETEKLWRENHQEKVKKYKRQQAVERNVENIFEKLEELEKQEQAELSFTIHKQMNENSTLAVHSSEPTSEEKIIQKKITKKRVSFSDFNKNQNYLSNDDDDNDEKEYSLNDINVIRFSHSYNKPVHFPIDDQLIQSPSDIYRSFFLNYNPKSILKNKIQNKQYEDHQQSKTLLKNINAENNELNISNINEYSNVFGDIQEKQFNEFQESNKSTRPISSFKKSRLQHNNQHHKILS